MASQPETEWQRTATWKRVGVVVVSAVVVVLPLVITLIPNAFPRWMTDPGGSWWPVGAILFVVLVAFRLKEFLRD